MHLMPFHAQRTRETGLACVPLGEPSLLSSGVKTTTYITCAPYVVAPTSKEFGDEKTYKYPWRKVASNFCQDWSCQSNDKNFHADNIMNKFKREGAVTKCHFWNFAVYRDNVLGYI